MALRVLGGAALAGGVGVLAGRALWWRSQEVPLTGRVAVVAGGSRGLGLAIARELLAGGCRVSIWARDAGELERAASTLGGPVHRAVCDVADPAAVATAVRSVEEDLGPVEVLFNVAGEIDVGPADAMTVQDFEHSLRVMFWGMLHPTLAVLPGMRSKSWGRLVNVTSIGGKVAVPHLLPYSAAKFAAAGLSEGLTSELRASGIRVTTVVPGLMRTGSHLAARFRGDAASEYGWFALAASAPLLSVNAERAARRIVTAARRGEPVVAIGATAMLAMWAEGVVPGAVVDAMSVVARLLPAGGDAPVAGRTLARERFSVAGTVATRRGRAPADRLNQASEV